MAGSSPAFRWTQASAEMSAIATRLNQAYPDERASNTQAKVMGEVEGRFEDMGSIFKSAGAIAMAIVGLDSSDRVCECRESDAGASCGASQRDRDSFGARARIVRV